MPRPQTITWVAVANAEHARVFEERHPGGQLQELADWDRRPTTEDDRRQARHEPGAQGRRFGRADVNPKDFAFAAEEKFIGCFADELRRAAPLGQYERLILVAPAKTLGILRQELGDIAAKRVDAALTCDCVDEDAEALEGRIAKLREARLS